MFKKRSIKRHRKHIEEGSEHIPKKHQTGFQKQHQKMINALEKGDNVKTIGGVFGTVTGVKADRVVIRIAENVKVEVAKDAVSAKV